jgi:hypothetical protein
MISKETSMKKNEETKTESKKKLVLRKHSIGALDNADLSVVAGGLEVNPPPPGGSPPQE